MLQTQDETKTMIEAPINLSRFHHQITKLVTVDVVLFLFSIVSFIFEFLCPKILLTLKFMKLQQIYIFLKAEVQKKFS